MKYSQFIERFCREVFSMMSIIQSDLGYRSHCTFMLLLSPYRAETVFNGVVIRPDADNPNSARMSLMFQTDMKGWIPSFLVNMFARSSPGQWRNSLAEYYHNVYSKTGPRD